MRLCCLKDKEIINACDCKILGHCFDLEFDECTGCIISLIIPGPAKICGLFGRETEFVIPFNCVKNIGPDVIIVEVNLEKCIHKCV